jgi:hypothetical protein
LGLGSEAFKVFKFETQGFDVIGNQGWKNTQRAVTREGGDCAFHILQGKMWALKIHACEPIYLNV